VRLEHSLNLPPAARPPRLAEPIALPPSPGAPCKTTLYVVHDPFPGAWESRNKWRLGWILRAFFLAADGGGEVVGAADGAIGGAERAGVAFVGEPDLAAYSGCAHLRKNGYCFLHAISK
jgi:hypothetical protein